MVHQFYTTGASAGHAGNFDPHADFMVDPGYPGDVPITWGGYRHSSVLMREDDSLPRVKQHSFLCGVRLIERGAGRLGKNLALVFCLSEGFPVFVHARTRRDLETYLASLRLAQLGYRAEPLTADAGACAAGKAL